VVRVFEDVISGQTFERPDLQALFDGAREGDTLCVVVSIASADPCASCRKPSISSKPAASDWFRSRKRLIPRPPPQLVFHVFGAIAHFERRLIAERTRDGRTAAAANSRRPGRNPLDPEKLEAAFTLIDAGPSVTKAVGIGRSTPTKPLPSAPPDPPACQNLRCPGFGRLLTVNFRTDGAGRP
jgi:Resolvase, N terminal domain